MSGRPGSVVYDEQDLAPFQTGAPVLLYVGRFAVAGPLQLAEHPDALPKASRTEGDSPTASAAAAISDPGPPPSPDQL